MTSGIDGSEHLPRASPATIAPRSTAAQPCGLSLQRRADRIMVGKRNDPVADDLAGLMALAGDQQHIAGAQAGDRRRGSPRARSPISMAPGAAARIAARIAAGSSLRGLSSVTMTMSARSAATAPMMRALALVAVAAAAEHHEQRGLRVRAAARRAPWRAHRACGRSRRRSARRSGVVPTRSSRPARALQVLEQRHTALRRSPPVAMARPAATSALEAWKAPTSGRRHARSAVMLDREALAEAVALGRDEPQGLAARPTDDHREAARPAQRRDAFARARCRRRSRRRRPCGSSSANSRSLALK